MNFAFFIREIDVEKLALPGDSFLHLIDPRVKILSLVILISGIVSMSHAVIPLLLFFLCAAVSLYIGMPMKKFLKRMGSLALLGLIVSTGVLLTHGGTVVLFRVLDFPIYQEAVVSAVALLTRMLAAVAFLQLFTAVTPLIEVLDALSWFRIPRVLTNLAAMMIRSVRLLSVETVRLYYALASRGGFSQKLNYRQKMNHLGTIAGALMIRAFNRSERTYRAMLSRGYHGTSRIVSEGDPAPLREWMMCGGLFVITTLLLIVDGNWVLL